MVYSQSKRVLSSTYGLYHTVQSRSDCCNKFFFSQIGVLKEKNTVCRNITFAQSLEFL